MKKGLLSGLLIAALVLILGSAQGVQGFVAVPTRTSTPPPPQSVAIKMADGLEIKGDYYVAQSAKKGPAALLLHQYGGSSFDWKDFANLLKQKGYNVLAVDLRGQGLTGGKADWKLAQSDTVALMGWLHDQPTVDPKRVVVMGASVGANLALRGCADDDACRVAIALSPGLSFYGVVAKDAISSMKNKAIFLAASQLDGQSGEPTKLLTVYAPPSVNIMTRVYASSAMHGMGLFTFDDLTPLIMQWLDKYNS
jgi:dienelactone hydrolase